MILGPILDHQRALGVIVIPDDVDHPIKVKERNDKPFKNLQAVIDLFHPVGGSAHQHVPAEIKKRAQHFL